MYLMEIWGGATAEDVTLIATEWTRISITSYHLKWNIKGLECEIKQNEN